MADPKWMSGKPVDTPKWMSGTPEEEPESPASRAGTMSAQVKPSAWELFKRTPTMQGLGDLPMAAIQVGSRLGMIPGSPVPDIEGSGPVAQSADKLARTREINYQNTYGRAPGASLSRAVAQSLPVAALPGAGPGASVAKRLGASALEGGLSALMNPVTDKADQRNLFASKAEQAGVGASASAFARYGLEDVAVPGVSKLINSLRTGGAVSPAAAKFVEDAELLGIKGYTAGQALGRGPVQAYEKYASEVPLVGPTGKWREGFKQLTDKAKSIDEKLAAQMKGAGYANYDELVEAAARGNRNASRLITDVIPAAEGDAYKTIQAGMQAEKARRGVEVGKLYREVEKIVPQDMPVNVDGTRAVLGQVIQDESGPGGNEVLKAEAEKMLKQIGDRGWSWSELRKASDKVGQLANTYGKSLDPQQSAASVMLRDVRDALRSEMNQHVEGLGIPEATRQLRNANKAYGELLGDYRTKDIRRLMDSTKPDEHIAAVVNKKGVDNFANTVYNTLDNKGKAAFRYAMFHDKLEKAGAMVNEGADMSLSRLASEIEADAGKFGKVYSKQDAAEMMALANVLRHMESSRLADVVFNNGAKMAKLGLVAGAAGGGATVAPATTGAVLGLGMLGKFFTSGPGKKFTLAAASLPPGHPMLEDIISKAVKTIPRTLGSASGQNEQQVEE